MKKLLLILLAGVILTGCNSKKDADYKAAAEGHIQKGNIAEAMNAYQSLVNDFPESPLAPEALYKIATFYQNKLVKNLSAKESLEKAAETFRAVFDKYPGSKQAPESLFMSGFIQANELKKFDDATKTYNLFISKFPTHELASSAKEELEYMGLTPEEILKKKSTSGI